MNTHTQQSGAWLERYSRQILLKQVGGHGQNRLGQAVVGIVGAGSMGFPLMLYLAAAGVGHLHIVDDQQTTAPSPTIDTTRAETASQAAQCLNPTILTTASNTTWHQDNAIAFVSAWDLTVLANNRLATRQTALWAAKELEKPFLSGWRHGHRWCIALFQAGPPPNTPCLLCPEPIHTAPPPNPQLARLANGVMGSILAMETLKALLGIGQGVKTTLLAFDPVTGNYDSLPTNQTSLCSQCRHHDNT